MPKPLSSLPPQVENRLAGWEQVQYRQSIATESRPRPTITISRQFGCEAFPLADRVGAQLEAATDEQWIVYDKTLIEKVAEKEGFPPRLLKNLGDISQVLESLVPAGHLTPQAAFDVLSKYILKIAQAGNAILVGRGGALVCRGLPHVFHFRLEAGEAWRIESIRRRLDLDQKAAEELVRSNSKLRERFLSKCLGENIAELRHYDAVFNNERHSIEEMAGAIVGYVRAGFPDRSYFKR